MDITARIAQFENMTQADPTNEMAFFSLGKAYGEAQRFADAAKAYTRCIELVPDMSKAYQLAGEMLAKSGQNDRAIAVLTQGHTIASGKGDLMPKNAMAKVLKELGAPVPEDAPGKGGGSVQVGIDQSGPVPDGMIRCRQSKRIGYRMTRPPFRGPIGEWIAANISQETWTTWIGQGTKVINELRLDLSRDKDQETYDQNMREFLGIDDDVLAEIGAKRS
ncbi:MAG: Fe(2+)-trafficking protein [Phycisphaerales bacterium]|jgi:Fe-S cluster biosynthesis and repair protein YggX|nr:Fe(2+)-trafficking protein [Phycisphaerales bacterium]